MSRKKFNYCLDLVRTGDISGQKIIYYDYFSTIVSVALKFPLDNSTMKIIIGNFMDFIKNNADFIPYINSPKKWIKEQISERAREHMKTRVDAMEAKSFPSNNEFQREFAEIFSELTESEKEIAVLYFAFNYKPKNIAKIIKLPVKNVRLILQAIFLKFMRLRE